ncbi:MAG: hypothetical protein IT406_01490 [Candidatus Yanofskybacteria bacterium]|nr:hypothetical protein [Candidatus Yanofskybacteria bacterium]
MPARELVVFCRTVIHPSAGPDTFVVADIEGKELGVFDSLSAVAWYVRGERVALAPACMVIRVGTDMFASFECLPDGTVAHCEPLGDEEMEELERAVAGPLPSKEE